MPDIFISYSRRNKPFVLELVEALKNRGKDSWLDLVKEPLQGIPHGSKWWDEIKYAIENVDNFLFVISPEAIASPYCHAEIAYARNHDKRIVTVLYCAQNDEISTLQAIDAAIEAIPDDTRLPDTVTAEVTHLRTLVRRNWLVLSGIQYVVFSEDNSFEIALNQLLQALNLDLAWIRMRSQIRQAAQLWEDNAYSDAYLWSQERLRPVDEMVERVKPDLSQLEVKFLEPEAQRLLRELEDVNTSHQRRSTIGERLSLIGDPRPGTGLSPGGLPDIQWQFCPDKTPFYIARFPITYIQYQCYLDDSSYAEAMRNPLMAASNLNLALWKLGQKEQRFKFVNHPRDNVSWIEAMGFCTWLSIMMGLPVRLPTEQEWRFAATGGDASKTYPWGIHWENNRANTVESGLSRTTAVGMYPAGASPLSALDMSGNVWEWCGNRENGKVITEPVFERVACGGSWGSDSVSATTKHRTSFLCDTRTNFLGFRVCYSAQ
jgi:hypothetical protein